MKKRPLPDTGLARIAPLPDTPDWCKCRHGIELDVVDDQEMRTLGLMARDWSELSAMVQSLPIEARGICGKNKRPCKLSKMSADMMRHALLRSHRSTAATLTPSTTICAMRPTRRG